MAYVSIPRLNPLRFFRTDDQSSNIQNFDNRGFFQETYFNENKRCYFQKYNIGDGIVLQITTSSTLKDLKRKDLNNNIVDLTSNWASVTSWSTADYGTVTVWQQTIDTSLLEGVYYFTLDFDSSESYQSEYINVQSTSDTHKYVYTHSETGQHKGIYFNGNQNFLLRIDSRFAKYDPGLQRITTENFNATLTNLNTDALRVITMELDTLPRFLIEKINVSFVVDTIKINDVDYETENGLDVEIIESGNEITNLYTGVVEFREKNYEQYDQLESDEEPETYYIDINGAGDDMLINDSGDKLTYF